MDTTLLQEALVYKAAAYRRQGVKYTEALKRAGMDLLDEFGEDMSPAEAYCLRLWLHGSGVNMGEDMESGMDACGSHAPAGARPETRAGAA